MHQSNQIIFLKQIFKSLKLMLFNVIKCLFAAEYFFQFLFYFVFGHMKLFECGTQRHTDTILVQQKFQLRLTGPLEARVTTQLS